MPERKGVDMDDKLVEKAQRGNKKAMGTLVSERYQKLYLTALGIITSPQDAEDAVQETALKAWLKVKALKEPEYFDTWLMRVLINTCRDMLRKKKEQNISFDLISNNVSEQSNFQDWLLFKDTVSVLNSRQQEIVVLRFAWEMTFKEIALITDQTEGTVKYQLKKAIEKLRDSERSGEVSDNEV